MAPKWHGNEICEIINDFICLQRKKIGRNNIALEWHLSGMGMKFVKLLNINNEFCP
jgi:hypothetical protein